MSDNMFPVITATTSSTTAPKVKAQPAYLDFLEKLVAKCDELGIPVTTWELKNFVGIVSQVNAHKIYVPKHAQEVRVLDTTVALPEATPGRIPLKAPNGKIASQYVPNLALIEEHLLPSFADSADRLPANRKPTKKA